MIILNTLQEKFFIFKFQIMTILNWGLNLL